MIIKIKTKKSKVTVKIQERFNKVIDIQQTIQKTIKSVYDAENNKKRD